MTTRGDNSPDERDQLAWTNTTRPSVSRIYDAMLGGKDNFQVDREIRDKLYAVHPDYGRLSWDNREFMLRVTRFLAAEAGINQILDLSVTLPASENLHEVAQRHNRETTVVYVSMDPGVLAHGRALLADNDRTHMAEADFRRPHAVFDNATVAKYIDFEQPVAIYHIGSLHHVGDSRDPAGMIAEYLNPFPSGSYVALSHLLDPGPDNELTSTAEGARQVYREIGFGGYFRTYDQIKALMAGLELLEPGLVTLADWWPDGPHMRPLSPIQRLAVGAVARKP